MSVSAKKIFGSALISGVCALAFGTTAHALETGCMPTSELKQALAAEGQKILVTGARQNGYDNANIFTANDNGDGYNIEGNTPLGTPSTQSCVMAKLKNVTLYNHEVLSPIPAAATFPNTSREEAEKICRDKKLGGCRYHEDFMAASYRIGDRLILSADLVVNGDAGLKFFVNANPEGERSGQVSVTVPSIGVNQITFAMKRIGMTQAGVDYYKKQTQKQPTTLAINQPN